MKTRRTIVIFWILLLVPTLLIAGMAVTLLSHEEERLNRAAVESLKDRVSAIADAVHLTVTEIEDSLIRSLTALERERIRTELPEWETTNPLVRNVFIWDRDEGLLWPGDSPAFTLEERRFAQRYDALFSGRLDWGHAEEGPGDAVSPAADTAYTDAYPVQQKEVEPGFSGRMEQFSLKRRQLLDLAMPSVMETPPEPEVSGVAQDVGKGWIPWFAENRLFLLGWVKNGSQVYGIELELMTLISRLVVTLPILPDPGAGYALVDGTGQVLHKAGDMAIDTERKPDFIMPVSRRLPHWQFFLYYDDRVLKSGSGFAAVGGMLLAIFTAAIFLGGGLLTWQARMNRLDAVKKTSFVSSVSHELKTPLTTIRMYAELLLSGRVSDPAKTGHYLAVIVSESQRLTRLVNNVLDFGRLEEKRKTYRPQRVALNGFIEELMDMHGIRINEAGMEVRMVLAEGIPDVSIDRDTLEQVVLNLIDNAVKYAASGGFLEIRTRRSGDGHPEILFSDGGPGIPEQHREAVFEMFYRVDNSLTADKPGSGLGLSIARRMLRDQGGDVFCRPNPGGGTCFTVRMTRYDA